MNLDELRDRLHDQADEIDLAEPAPLHALRRRTAKLRRQRVAAGAGAAAVCCALVAAVAVNGAGVLSRAEPATGPSPAPLFATPTNPPDGLPVKEIANTPGDYVKNGVRYQAKIGDAELQDAQVGTSSVSFQWNVVQDLVDFRAFCTLPGDPAASVARVVVRVDGRAVTSRPCTSTLEPEAGERPGIGAPGLGIQLATSMQVTATVVDSNNRPVVRAGMTTGVGVYTRGPGREVREGYRLPTRIQHHGQVYRWADSMTAPVVSGAGPQGVGLETPAFKPFLLAFGTVGVPGTHSFEIAGTPGGEQFAVRPADGPGGSIFYDAVPPQAAGQVELRQTGRAPTVGDLVIALYLPE